MSTFYQILALVAAGLIVWFTYAAIKNQPNQFSREKINKSLYSMGILALGLILFVGLLILFVRAGT
jgi:TRAP-type C4-dicarboxylate transport system permease small subunit